ncbi:MAG: hypothetical protein H0U07_09380 [Actinobacteria bacterium]|nr:hypothetical protein [Actinomycetota bacterium]
MKRLGLVICAWVLVAVAAGPASAANLCVGVGPGCFSTLQAAVSAAKDGDTVNVGQGTFAGGVTIDKSIALVGGGSNVTIISGGGPVLTIFRESAPDQLTVSIRGVTITGGVNDSKPDPPVTFGGGIWIPTSQLPAPPFNGTGATVTIDDSLITGNTVTSRAAIPPFGFCGPLPCGFNNGGGIDNGGVLTITDSRITNNTAGSTSTLATLASGVSAGGISNRFLSTLVLRRSVVSGNRSVASLPNGQEATAGGIGSFGALTIEDSVVSDNAAEVTGTPPGFDEPVALAGGIRVGGDPNRVATIRNTLVNGNRAVADVGSADKLSIAFAGGILAEAPLLLERAVVSGNLVRAVSAGDAAADGGGLEVDSTVTIRDSIVARNVVIAEAGRAALAQGGGIANAGQLTVERTLVQFNRVRARGAGGMLPFGEPSGAFGGGIWNGTFGGPPPTLTLTDSAILANSLDAPPGFLEQGGGVYTTFPITRTRTLIAFNRPDQCFGC